MTLSNDDTFDEDEIHSSSTPVKQKPPALYKKRVDQRHQQPQEPVPAQSAPASLDLLAEPAGGADSPDRSATLDSRATSVSVASGGGSCRLNVTLETSDRARPSSSSSDGGARDRPPPPSLLCCAGEEAEDFQVDLCPRSWFDLRGSAGFCDAVWRVLVIVCCLPLCYPCYLTRRCRHKRKRVMDISTHSAATTHPKMLVTKAHRLEV